MCWKELATPWNRVLVEKRTGPQLVKKFLAFCGTPKFITAFKRAHHLLIYLLTAIG
jgi:hypothetical protein